MMATRGQESAEGNRRFGESCWPTDRSGEGRGEVSKEGKAFKLHSPFLVGHGLLSAHVSQRHDEEAVGYQPSSAPASASMLTSGAIEPSCHLVDGPGV
ncbi:hypothetical protein AAFF_G00217440 [Aldrovandia affinis]|uniref:Uncharacterized protein n=1 Tax=Aldrovandia affinis TaxID=143900 RepID=A0AAD7SVZ2_9TELE|nr:hypothetical protein AAFF_G00217440 [Aldrovandia affinis]